MAQAVARFAWQNFVQLGNTALRASSTESGRAVRWLRDQARSKTWRSATGWNLAQRFNDELAITEGSVRRVVYAPGNYATGAAAASAIQAAANASGIDPLSLTPTAWYRAEKLEAADGGAVSSWADSSGNGRDLDQVSGSPSFFRNVLNGRAAVRFDGSSYLYGSATMADLLGTGGSLGHGTVYAVVWVDSSPTVANNVFSDAPAGSPSRALSMTPTPSFAAQAYDGSADVASMASTAGAWHLVVWRYDGTNVEIYADDQDTAAVGEQTASGSQTDLNQVMRVGEALSGYVAELLFFDSAHSEENRRRITATLKQKYGLSDDATTAPTWGNTYSAAYSSSKFTLARASGADTFELPWTHAEWSLRSMGASLGFDVSADDTGGTSYTADGEAYHGTEFVQADLGGVLTARQGVLINHNAGAGGTFTLQANDSPFWESPAYEVELAGDEDIRIAFFGADKSYRYWRVLVEDVGNEDGFSEFGIWYVGSYTELATGYRPGWEHPREELSQVGLSDHGAPFFDDKPTILGYNLTFDNLSSADRTALETMSDYVKRSRCLFLSLDADTDPTDTHYVFLPDGLSLAHVPDSYNLFSTAFTAAIPPA